MRSPSPHRNALARVSANLAFGLAPFALITGLHPAIPPDAAVPTWLCQLASILIAGCLNLGAADTRPGTPLRRILSCLLLGSSVAALSWNAGSLPFFPAVMAIGFVCRWWLYLLETRDLRIADRRRLALPCLATRLRRGVTWITGAAIPLLVAIGLPPFALLLLSFVLTAFSQWTVAGEACFASPGRIDPRDGFG